MRIPSDEIRPAAVAGRFYPASSSRLQRTLDDLFDRAAPAEFEGDLLALVAPHAGYAYSGRVAASSFKRVAGRRFNVVFVLSPSHRDVFDGVSVYTGKGYETPLGLVPVDRERARALVEYDPDCLHETRLGHRLEHGVEVELPFLQRVLASGWRLVPLVMAERSSEVCVRTARAIMTVAGDAPFLVVASSDLYHGYSYDACHATDARTLAGIERLDPEAFLQGLAAETCQACGGGPIAVAMHIARDCGVEGTRLIAHTTSGDVTGERQGYVVGYGAVVFFRARHAPAAPRFDEAERRALLQLARSAIPGRTEGTRPSEAGTIDLSSSRLSEAYGVFVTLRRGGALRGCIGNIQSDRPLHETVGHIARAAATQDPRFPPVRPEEMDDLTVSISILSDMTPLRDTERLQVGTHGLYIRRYGVSGLLLPQVATDRGWDRVAFLEHVCHKAGLPPEAWKDPETELFVFTTETFGDDAP